MRQFLTLLALASALALSPVAQAQTTEVAGTKFPNTAQVGGSKLTLNGAGVRLKVVFQVYAAGLYLGDKAVTPEAALAAPGPKRLHLVMLREIDANELGKLFTKGMEMNAQRDEFSKSITGLLRMSDLFSRYKKLQPGETLTVDWQPGVGTVIIINGKADGAPIKEPEFHTALMKIWLGMAPADPQLKEALLGRAPVAVNPAANYN